MRSVADALLVALALACDAVAHAADADIRRGAEAIRAYGCGACHRIPGIAGAHGRVGPPLGDLSTRAYLAGRLPNTPANLARWIEAPQQVRPGGAMPDMRVTPDDARAMAAWLSRAP